MKCKLIAPAVLALVFSFADDARADSILYYVDLNLGTDRMAEALSTLGGGHTVTVATSIADFTTLIAGGTFDIGIFAQQNSSGASYDAAFSALSTFVAGGGKAIVNDWTRNDTHVAPFNGDFTGGTNQTAITVSLPTLLTGITNPVNLFNPGWGVFSTGLAPLAGGSVAATFGNGEGAIIYGNGGRTFINGFLYDTFSDGSEGSQLLRNELEVLLAQGSRVPEPATATLLALGFLGVAGARRRRRKVAG